MSIMLSPIKTRLNVLGSALNGTRRHFGGCAHRHRISRFASIARPTSFEECLKPRYKNLSLISGIHVRSCSTLPPSHDSPLAKDEADDLDEVHVPVSIIPDVKEFWRKNSMKIEGRDPPKPIFDFNELEGVSPKILSVLKSLGFEKPTPIQSQCWPIALAGRDVVGIAQTGSGKTLSYLLPAIVKIEKIAQSEGYDYRDPLCLVLAPTRELAQQIKSVADNFRQASKAASSVCIFGGASRSGQIEALGRHKPAILIATPGRLLDLMREGYINMSKIRFLVLDEADRMLDMGFEPQVTEACRNIPPDSCQTMMWSATWPDEVRQLASQFLNDYIQIVVGGTELTVNSNIEQRVEVLDQWRKLERLEELIEEINPRRGSNKTLIFAGTQNMVENLTHKLNQKGYRAKALHGRKTQRMRDQIMSDFRAGICSILIATDVAARGLDVKDIQYVINYDFPQTHEDYIHRIGRTGRVENKGIAYTLLTERDASDAQRLIDILQSTNQQVPQKLHSLVDIHKRQAYEKRFKKMGSRGYRKLDAGYSNQRDFPPKGKFQFRASLLDEDGEEEYMRDERYERKTRPRSQSYNFETNGRSRRQWKSEFDGKDGWHPELEAISFK